MDSPPGRVDRADVRATEDELTLVLSSGGVDVLQVRLRYHDGLDEMVNNAGTVATAAVNAWALIDHDLSLELDEPSAASLGVPSRIRLHLDVDGDAIRRVRTALLKILQSACFVVDTPDGRISG